MEVDLRKEKADSAKMKARNTIKLLGMSRLEPRQVVRELGELIPWQPELDLLWGKGE